jgi:hypothetical protein
MLYDECLTRHCRAIVDGKDNFNHIVATLGLTGMIQGTLIPKLCTYTSAESHATGLDKLIRDIEIKKVSIYRAIAFQNISKSLHR